MRRLPQRVINHAASGRASTAPTAMDSSTSPRRWSASPCWAFTAGMCETQLASTAPFTKKMADTAQRACAGGEVITVGPRRTACITPRFQ